MATTKDGSGGSSAVNGDGAVEKNSDDDGEKLVLKSPMGNEPRTYSWPLKKGKGSLRRSEDKQDEAAEIVETIRWVSEDVKEIKDAVETSGILRSYDATSYESMKSLCSVYNKAVDKLVTKEGGTSRQERRWGRVSRPHLRHILQMCYNKSVTDPNELNNYEAFTPEVYGETSFELICQILDKLDPISEDNRFVDLGSGVGQVVLQVAALTDCKVSLGIEKAGTPAKYAEDLKQWFEFWMNFYGKRYSEYKLVHGDFLDKANRPSILESTIVFVNNFAFGPEVDQHLKDIFADLSDGARIFSSKSFCALNFRITDRNLSDIGTIMHISKMDPLKGSVSWTGKPVSYFLHVIDRAKLERYFQKHKKQDEDGKRGKKGRGGGGNGSSGAVTENSMGADESSCGSRDDSRASSVEKDMNSMSLASSADHSNSSSMPQTPGGGAKRWTGGSEEDTPNSSPVQVGARTVGRGKIKKLQGGRRKRRRANAELQGSLGELVHPDKGEATSTPTDSNSSTPPPALLCGGDASGVSRPVRAVVANAAAINEAQIDMQQGQLKKRGRKPNPEMKKSMNNRNKKGAKAPMASNRIIGLDFLHKTMMDGIEASVTDIVTPQGCVNERLSHLPPEKLVHEELPVSMNASGDGGQLPFQLQLHLEKCKQQYLSFIRHMKDPVFRTRVQADLDVQKKRNRDLLKREKQLKAQIENLISDSLGMLKCKLNELGIHAKSPPEFIEKAKGIVCNHHDLQKGKANLEAEIRQLEADQEKIIAAKEMELYETMVKTGISTCEAKAIVSKQIENAISRLSTMGAANGMAPLLNKLSDVTLTKCSSDQLPSSTQIRKRQASKQRDWPEKRHKPIPVVKEKVVSPVGRVMLSPRSNAAIVPPPPVEVRKLTPRGFESNPQLPGPQISVPRGAILPPPPPKSYALNRTVVPSVDLPKIDLSVSLSKQVQDHPLVLPPHPDSRSRSSEQTAEDVSFASNKVNSTPRVEQFEDRLKTIIHSVLTGDDENKDATAASAKQPTPQSAASSSKPMFSPVKKELPTHLPPPPSGVVCSDPSKAPSPKKLPAAAAAESGFLPHHPGGGVPVILRNVGDVITSEMEKQHPRGSKAAATSSSSSSSGMARMSQVIEDSIRGHVEAASRSGEGMDQHQMSVPEDHRRVNGGGDDYRFQQERSCRMQQQSPRRGYYEMWSQQQPSSLGGPIRPPHDAHTSSDSSRGHGYQQHRYGGAPYMHPPPPAQPQEPQRPYPPPPPAQKRHSQSPQMQLPPKKQHFEAAGDGGNPAPRAVGPHHKTDQPEDTSRSQKWQEEISTGFDRLVAYATEFDKRNKSGGGGDVGGGGPERNPPKEEGKEDDFDRMSALSMKFKRAAHFSPAQKHSLPTRSSSIISSSTRNLATSSIPHDLLAASDDGSGPKTGRGKQQAQQQTQLLPGEKMPEHHFKKRYFARSGHGEDSQTPSSISVVKKRPSMLGGNRKESSCGDDDKDKLEVSPSA